MCSRSIKINNEELPVIAEMFGLQGAVEDQLAELADLYKLKLVALTRGGDGSLVYSNGRLSELAGTRIAVVDTIGACDAFTAAMALGWLAGWDLDGINKRANAFAAFVCTPPGATPPLPAELTDRFGGRTGPPSEPAPIVHEHDAA